MPNHICFPGGGTDKTDETKDWIDFLKKHKVPFDDLRPSLDSKRPFIFEPREGLLEREISLRLTAIRETFEELGIILCRSPNGVSSPFSDYYHSKTCDIPVWQKKIHDHKDSLMNFCEEFKLVPDIMNIHEWSCWLTPTFFRPRRFETAFFFVALNSVPPVYPESNEVQEFLVRIANQRKNLKLISILLSFLSSGKHQTRFLKCTSRKSFGCLHLNFLRSAE